MLKWQYIYWIELNWIEEATKCLPLNCAQVLLLLCCTLTTSQFFIRFNHNQDITIETYFRTKLWGKKSSGKCRIDTKFLMMPCCYGEMKSLCSRSCSAALSWLHCTNQLHSSSAVRDLKCQTSAATRWLSWASQNRELGQKMSGWVRGHLMKEKKGESD